MARKKTVTGYSIDTDLAKRIGQLSKAQGVSASALVNRLLREAVEFEDRATAALANPAMREALVKAMGTPGFIRGLSETLTDELDPEQLDLFAKHVEEAAAKVQVVKKKATKKGRKS